MEITGCFSETLNSRATSVKYWTIFGQVFPPLLQKGFEGDRINSQLSPVENPCTFRLVHRHFQVTYHRVVPCNALCQRGKIRRSKEKRSVICPSTGFCCCFCDCNVMISMYIELVRADGNARSHIGAQSLWMKVPSRRFCIVASHIETSCDHSSVPGRRDEKITTPDFDVLAPVA